MKISMWILADRLKEYAHSVMIETGAMTVQNVRIVPSVNESEVQTVFVMPITDCDGHPTNKLSCANSKDQILLDSGNPYAVLNTILASFEYFNDWQERVMDIIRDKNSSIQQIVDISDDLFMNPIVIYNADHMVAAFSNGYEEKLKDVDPEWGLISTTHSNSLKMYHMLNEHIRLSKNRRGIRHLNFPFVQTTALERVLFHNGHAAGRVLVMEYFQKMTVGQEQLLDVFCSYIEQWLTSHQNDLEMQEECSDFLRILHKEIVVPERVIFKLSLSGWSEDHNKLLYKIVLSSQSQETIFPLFNRISRFLDRCYVFRDETSIYILENTIISMESEVLERLTELQRETEFICGVSFPFQDIMRLWNADEQCNIAIAYAENKRTGVFYCSNFALNYIKSALSSPVLDSAVHPALAILKANDAINQGGLYYTLYVYLTHNCNVTHTAQILHLHRNSLLYRLDRIRELTDLSLDDAETREYLYLSFVHEGLF